MMMMLTLLMIVKWIPRCAVVDDCETRMFISAGAFDPPGNNSITK